MGVPLRRSVMFGDSQADIISSTVPHSQIKKQHYILSCHRVRTAAAANIFPFHHLPGDINPADILSKHWGFQQAKKQLKAMLFKVGDTMEIDDDEHNVLTKGE